MNIPLHPLLVHVPVVLLPVAGLLAQLGEESDILERHEQYAEISQIISVVFLLAVNALVALYWRHSPRVTRNLGAKVASGYLPLALITIASGIALTVFIVLTGHAGATSVWQG